MRRALFEGKREEGLRLAGLTGEKPVLLMTGGSLGAQSVNACLREALPDLLPDMDVIHICGKGNVDESLNGTAGYAQFGFVNEEMPHLLAAADAVLSRAGSNTLCELQALYKPMLLIPYPLSASRGDQVLNARSYERRGLAMVLEQEQMNRQTLVEGIHTLFSERQRLTDALHAAPEMNGTARILEMIEEVQA